MIVLWQMHLNHLYYHNKFFYKCFDFFAFKTMAQLSLPFPGIIIYEIKNIE